HLPPPPPPLFPYTTLFRSRSTAPVNEPRSWPKISLSSNVSGIAAQLTATNGPLRRGESSWTVRATNSLPVPLSPAMKSVASVGRSEEHTSELQSRFDLVCR